MRQLSYEPTPIHEIKHPSFEAADVKVLVKREDLNNQNVSGNKWWKLKYNIEEAQLRGCNTLLTFGGAYSNHIYATAAAAFDVGLQSIGIIRGDELQADSNPTLSFAGKCGMRFEFIDRSAYRNKSQDAFLRFYQEKYPSAFIIPEGGTNDFAVRGVREFANDHLSSASFDHLFLAVGTGGTIAGLINGLEENKKIVGVAVMKGGSFLINDVTKLLDAKVKANRNWKILTDFHFGGYGKITSELIEVVKDFEVNYGLPLDPIYTGKAMAALMSEVQQGSFERGSTILFLHTGGLQGRSTFLPSSNFRSA